MRSAQVHPADGGSSRLCARHLVGGKRKRAGTAPHKRLACIMQGHSTYHLCSPSKSRITALLSQPAGCFPPHLSAPKAGMAPGGSPRHRSDLFSNGDRPKVDRHYPSFTQEFKITVQHACWWPTCESEGLERRCRPARMSLTTSLHSTSGAPHSSSTGVHPRMPALLREPRILPRGSAAGLVRGSLGLGRVVAQISWPPPAHAAPSGVSRCTRPLYHRCWLGVGGAPGCGCDKRQRGRSDASPSS